MVEAGQQAAAGEFVVFATDSAEHRIVVDALEGLGWQIVGHSALQKSYQVRVPKANSLELLQQAAALLVGSIWLEGVTLNTTVTTLGYPISDPIAVQTAGNRRNWPFVAIDAYAAWEDVYAGKDDSQIPMIRLGIVDSWFEPGEADLSVDGALASNVNAQVEPNLAWKLAHGNFVAGIIGAKTDAFWTLGMAHRRVELKGYSVRFVRSLIQSGTIDSFTMLGSLEKAVNEDARIVNLSMGGGIFNDCTIRSILNIVKAANGRTLFVGAAGNRATESTFQPYFADGNRSSPFGIAATLERQTYSDGLFNFACGKRSESERAEIRQHTLIVGSFAPSRAMSVALEELVVPSYSEFPLEPGVITTTSKGQADLDMFFPYLLAPGGELRGFQDGGGTTIDNNSLVSSNSLPFSGQGSEDYGTSYASPHVAGVAALMMQANSSLTAAQVRDLILLSALKRCTDGYLVLNAARAVALARSPGAATVPVCEPSPATTVSSATCTTPLVGLPMTCTVNGSKLPASLSFTATNCTPQPMLGVAGGTATSLRYTCTPITTGIPVEVSYQVPGFIGPLPLVPTLPAGDPATDGFVWPVEPTNPSLGHQGTCQDQANGCYWLSDESEAADLVWRDAQPFQQEANTEIVGPNQPRWHLGADYNRGAGNADLAAGVYAAAVGVVAAVYEDSCAWGNVVMLRHETATGPVVTMYAHVDWLDGVRPQIDSLVRRGQLIARIARVSWTSPPCSASGSFSAHLHFELRRSSNVELGRGYTNIRLRPGTLGLQSQTDPNVFIRNRLVPSTLTSGPLNDTGIPATMCYRAGSNAFVSCTSPEAIALNPQQDGMVGRDVTDPDPIDGKLGFSYSLVPKPGGGFYDKTECVKDNVTGLMWEGKTSDGGLRDANRGYTNWGDGRTGDTSAFVADVNGSGLCGHRDWRLPNRHELQGLVDYGVASPGPTIDTGWFLNCCNNGIYWTSSPLAGYPDFASRIHFSDGHVLNGLRTIGSFVRLVR